MNYLNLNAEQSEAHMKAAAERNPNRDRIAAIRAQMKVLSAELSPLLTDDEMGRSVMAWMARVDEAEQQVKGLTNQELGSLCIERIWGNLGDLDMAILDELLRRAGYVNREDV